MYGRRNPQHVSLSILRTDCLLQKALLFTIWIEREGLFTHAEEIVSSDTWQLNEIFY